MAKPWDDCLKKLVHADPQAFVSWFVPGCAGYLVHLYEKPVVF